MAQPFSYNEVEAVKLLVEGRPEGFHQIYDRYVFAVTRVGFRFLQSTELTEDLVQEVFSRLWVHREKFATVESVEKYLITMCRNRAIDHLKASLIRKLGEGEYAQTRLTSENNAERNILDKECLVVMQKAVDGLPATQKRVFELVTNEGLSHKEVACLLNISEQTVANLMAKVFKTTKENLGQHLVTILWVSSHFIQRYFI